MKSIKILFIICFSSNIFCQSYVDYDKFANLLFKNPSENTIEFIKIETKKTGKESEIRDFLKLNNEIKNIFSEYKGKKIYAECKSLAKSAYYYLNLAKKTKESFLEDKRKLSGNNSKSMRKLYITRYNNGVRNSKEYLKKGKNYNSEYKECVSFEKYKHEAGINKIISLQKEFLDFYKKRLRNDTNNSDKNKLKKNTIINKLNNLLEEGETYQARPKSVFYDFKVSEDGYFFYFKSFKKGGDWDYYHKIPLARSKYNITIREDTNTRKALIFKNIDGSSFKYQYKKKRKGKTYYGSWKAGGSKTDFYLFFSETSYVKKLKNEFQKLSKLNSI